MLCLTFQAFLSILPIQNEPWQCRKSQICGWVSLLVKANTRISSLWALIFNVTELFKDDTKLPMNLSEYQWHAPKFWFPNSLGKEVLREPSAAKLSEVYAQHYLPVILMWGCKICNCISMGEEDTSCSKSRTREICSCFSPCTSCCTIPPCLCQLLQHPQLQPPLIRWLLLHLSFFSHLWSLFHLPLRAALPGLWLPAWRYSSCLGSHKVGMHWDPWGSPQVGEHDSVPPRSWIAEKWFLYLH